MFTCEFSPSLWAINVPSFLRTSGKRLPLSPKFYLFYFKFLCDHKIFLISEIISSEIVWELVR